MVKRKREAAREGERAVEAKPSAKKAKAQSKTPAKEQSKPAAKAPAKAPTTASAKAPTKTRQSNVFKLGDSGPVTIQIVAGSYDRVLHGVTATVTSKSVPPTATTKAKGKKDKDASPPQPQLEASFADTFLFNAHNSAIRCLALSPPSAPVPGQSQKVLLATGSTDERINIYNISAHPPRTSFPTTGDDEQPATTTTTTDNANDAKLLSSLTPRPILENPHNRELGTLLHHASNITRLSFPNRAKLLSAAEDSTIAVTRTRDWTLLHSFKCPVPKAQGRPSGDTAPLGGVPQGVNDFGVHPSGKVMISVSKGERCMRLWNLETGRKSRVLNFERGVLGEVGEGRRGGLGLGAGGEGRRIVWGRSGRSSKADGKGEGEGGEEEGGEEEEEFAVGFDRDVVVFGMDCVPKCRVMKDVRTKVHEFCYLEVEEEGKTVLAVSTEDGRVLFFSTAKEDLGPPPGEGKTLPVARLVGQLGGKEAGVAGRIKDFAALPVEDADGKRQFYIVTGSSDGRIRLWHLDADDLRGEKAAPETKRVGKLLGTYETQNRITCLAAFVMIPRPQGAEESEYEFDSDESEDDSDDE